MKLKEYQEKSRTTALYPNVGNNIIYPILGLCGEIGEAFEKIKTSHIAEEIHKELGDVMWYVSQVTSEINEDLQTLFDESTKIFVKGTEYEFIRDNELCIIYASKIAEVGKKAIRDNGGVLDDVRMSKVRDNLVNFIHHLSNVVEIQHGEVGEICQGNIDKLFSRKERGVIQGSGDNR